MRKRFSRFVLCHHIMEKYYERITTILDKTQLIVKEIQLVSSVRSCCAQFCSLSVDDD